MGKRTSAQGFVLIVVIGLSALLLSLSLAFLASVRRSAGVTEGVVREAQARTMLHAGMAFILESSRMGYGPDPRYGDASVHNGLIANPDFPGSGDLLQHREGYGWIDVRDNSAGPKDQAGTPVWVGRPGGHNAGAWPEVGGTAICPMHRWTRTRYEIQPTVAPNPIEQDPAKPTYGYPFLNVPDPAPAGMLLMRDQTPGNPADGSLVANPSLNDAGALEQLFTANSFIASEMGGGQVDPTPVANSFGQTWFRVHRVMHPTAPDAVAATFIITCGSGGTFGFRDWAEVQDPSDRLVAFGGLPRPYTGLFGNNQAVFEALLKAEVRLWYEVRWSASVQYYAGEEVYKRIKPRGSWGVTKDWLPAYPFTPDRFSACNDLVQTFMNQSVAGAFSAVMASGKSPNHLGTISYIQRLDMAVGAGGRVGYVQPARDPTDPTRVYVDW